MISPAAASPPAPGRGAARRTDAPIAPGPMTLGPGLLTAAVLLCLYGSLALTVDFPRAAIGIQSDEATYYMMGHSLAADGDLTYRHEDLVRVWRDFPAGPSGVFLKKGRIVTGIRPSLKPPFFRIISEPDPDQGRYFYGKAFIYPLFAAPFVKVFGTNGFLVLHALLLALVVLCGYLFLHARAPAVPSLLIASAFVIATVVPVYFVWITPELFNFSLGVLAYFCWLYKEVATPERSPRGTAWLFGARSDLVAAILLGIATFSKLSNALLLAPIVVWLLVRRRWSRSVASVVAFALAAAGLFALNVAISGDWNYQGGADRRTYYFEFPLQNPGTTATLGNPKSREDALTSIIFDPEVFTSNLVHNAAYFFVGRNAGIVAYFFPAVFALAAFLAAPRRRPAWQWLVLAAGLAQAAFFVIVTPYTWNGGGGSVGNRYFMGAYGVFLFLLPPIASTLAAMVPWVIGGLFVAPMVLNPFVASFRPGDNPKSGPLRLLPVELTLVNDLPINNEGDKARQWYGENPGEGDPGFLVYFLDNNSYGREADKSFWVKGESRAEFLIKTDRPMKRAVFTLTAGPVPVDVKLTVGGRTQSTHVEPGAAQQLAFALPPGFPYHKETHALVWVVSVSTSNGFTPVFYGSNDTRYLGIRVKPTLVLP